MQLTSLPDAIQHEREALLRGAIAAFQREGFQEFAAKDLQGYADPEHLVVPVLNAPMQPDVLARGPNATAVGVVEVSTDLGEEACGRRWQGLAAWAEEHGARLTVFVHPEDERRAQDIARHWHLDTGLIRPLARR